MAPAAKTKKVPCVRIPAYIESKPARQACHRKRTTSICKKAHYLSRSTDCDVLIVINQRGTTSTPTVFASNGNPEAIYDEWHRRYALSQAMPNERAAQMQMVTNASIHAKYYAKEVEKPNVEDTATESSLQDVLLSDLLAPAHFRFSIHDLIE